MLHPVISDVEGLEFSAEEWAMFSEQKPFGFILFQRNCESPEQVKALTDQMRKCIGNDDIPILIDQEGGRVARLRPPNWQQYPAGGVFSKMYDTDPKLAVAAIQVHACLMASKLIEVGINVDCYPPIDLYFDGAHKVIGDRALGENSKKVTELARAASEGLLSCGVMPVIKHIPGHGRADVDSHLELPVVDTDLKILRENDFIPFNALNDLPCAMTAHIIYSQIDPDNCATNSKKVIKDIIREEIGFSGILFSDDISMKAMKKTAAENAVDCLKAGCDIALHCNGSFEERKDVLSSTSPMGADQQERLFGLLKRKREPREIDHDKLYGWLMDVTKEYS